MSKNIWILNHYAITPDMPGGTRHYDFGKELVKRGYDVTIFASSFHHYIHKEMQLTGNEKYKIENVDGINFIWIKTFPYQKNDWRRVLNMISYMWRVYWLGRKITKIDKSIKTPDVLYASSPHLFTVLSTYQLSKYYKVNFIMEVRDLWPQTFVDTGNFKKENIIIQLLYSLEKFLYKKANKIIILPPLAKKYITDIGINENKIIWISNGTDLSKFLLTKTTNNEIFETVYSGAFGLANNVKVILRTAEILKKKNYKKIKFFLFGDGPEKESLIKYKKEKNIDNLEIMPPVSKEKITEKLINADILLVHFKKSQIHKYGISFNKLFDYMAASKPIIFAVDSRNNPVEEAKCGILVPPENPEKMAKAIIKLYNMSPEERQMMGQRGREYVEKYHSIPILVDKLEKVFQEVI